MIAAAVVHFVQHWSWVKMMARRLDFPAERRRTMTRAALDNVLIDMVVGVSFVLTAVSGLYFWLAPGHDLHLRPTNGMWSTPGGVVMVRAAVEHFASTGAGVKRDAGASWAGRLPVRRVVACGCVKWETS
jgi:hypothetical protein